MLFRLLTVSLFLFLLSLDIVSKQFALHFIPHLQWGGYPFGGIAVFADFFGISFSLNTIFNTGAAWGAFNGYPGLLFFLRVAIIAAFGIYFYCFQKQVVKRISFQLIGAGAIGNALDYLLYGHVVDFFHLVFWGYSFPIFNLADSYITLGAIRIFLKRKHTLKSYRAE